MVLTLNLVYNLPPSVATQSSVRPPQQPTQTPPTPLQSIAVRAPLLQLYCTVHGLLLQLQLILAEARMTPALSCSQTT